VYWHVLVGALGMESNMQVCRDELSLDPLIPNSA
jgi:hypothetical protein